MSSSYTHLSDISVSGKVSSSKQGTVIGTVTVQPGTTGGLVASECSGITVMYNGDFYTSNGSTWTKQEVGAEQVQADWNQTTTTAKDYIKNKPTIPVVPDLDKNAATGTGNVVTDINVSGHTITPVKGLTVLTQHQDISGLAPKASPAFTGTPTAPTASTGTNTTQIATTAFVRTEVDSRMAANDAMIFKGTIGTGGTVTAIPATHNAGWTYKVITAATYAGKVCEVGDMIICVADGTAANNDHWAVLQTNVDGAVTGPASSTDAHIALFDGSSGKVIKDSGQTIASAIAGKQDAISTSGASSGQVLTWNGSAMAWASPSGGGADIYSNIAASTWASDSTYTDFGYRCAIAITGVTANDVAEVVFAQAEASSGNYASVCETYAGGVYIYSSVNTAITIPTILIHKG